MGGRASRMPTGHSSRGRQRETRARLKATPRRAARAGNRPNGNNDQTDLFADGQRKLLTVLFADIVNSSSVVAAADPEAANEDLLLSLQAMIDAVHRFGGTVTQILISDGQRVEFDEPLVILE